MTAIPAVHFCVNATTRPGSKLFRVGALLFRAMPLATLRRDASVPKEYSGRAVTETPRGRRNWTAGAPFKVPSTREPVNKFTVNSQACNRHFPFNFAHPVVLFFSPGRLDPASSST